MKRFTLFLTLLLLVVFLTACGEQAVGTSTKPTTTTTAAPTTAPTATTTTATTTTAATTTTTVTTTTTTTTTTVPPTTTATTTTTMATTVPTTAAPTLPPAPTPQDDIGDSGVCAVGIVLPSTDTAKVLTQTGEVATITYVGTAPKAGELYRFLGENGMYTLFPVEYSMATFIGVRTHDETPLGEADYFEHWDSNIDGPRQIFLTDETVVFIRYSATEWRQFSGKDVIQQNKYPMIALFTEKVVGEIPVCDVMMVVGCDFQTGEVLRPTYGNTFFFDPNGVGWANGDIIIS